jgi:transcriptional regulator with XRE-family HTH domain
MEDGKKNDPDANDPEARLAMVLFFYLGGWRTQGQLAQASGIARSQISEYFEGKRAIPRQALEKIAAAAGFPVHLLSPVLGGLRSFRAAARGRSRASRVFADGVAAELIVLVQMAADLVLPTPTRRPTRARKLREAGAVAQEP